MKSTKLFKFAILAAMVAATVFANSCKKQENTIDTPKERWQVLLQMNSAPLS